MLQQENNKELADKAELLTNKIDKEAISTQLEETYEKNDEIEPTEIVADEEKDVDYEIIEDDEENPSETESNSSERAEKSRVDLQTSRFQLKERLSSCNSNLPTGTAAYIIPESFLYKVLEMECSSIEELQDGVGKLHPRKWVDENGDLVRTDVYFSLDEQTFTFLVNWFGIVGAPIKRMVMANFDGYLDVELFPPRFSLHTVNSRRQTGSGVGIYGRNNVAHARSLHHEPANSLSVSSRTTVRELIEKIKSKLRYRPEYEVRIWQLEPQNIHGDANGSNINVDELASTVSLAIVDELDKKLVSPGLYDSTLQGMELSSHFLVEMKDKQSGVFPLESRGSEDSTDTAGRTGLSNLGNTCYMNSALQCLAHVPEISEYFLYDVFKQEINESNPLGMNGKVANAFGALIHQLFSSKRETAISPREFKSVIGHYGPMFADYHQQDSQEFLAFLLDGLHEDLNRILSKPYTEKPELSDDQVSDPAAIRNLAEKCWEKHKLRNDSLIIDLFTGLYKSTLVCPVCSKVSITFDPFSDLTLPLPIEKKWYGKVLIFPQDGFPEILEIELNKTSNLQDLRCYISGKTDLPESELYIFEIFNNSFYRDFQAGTNLDYLPIPELISDSDQIVVYHLTGLADPTTIVVPIFQSLNDGSSYVKSFGLPTFLTLSEQESYDFSAIKSKLQHRTSQLTTYYKLNDIAQSEQEPEFDIRLAKLSAPYHRGHKMEEKSIVKNVLNSNVIFKGLDRLIDRLPISKKRHYEEPLHLATVGDISRPESGMANLVPLLPYSSDESSTIDPPIVISPEEESSPEVTEDPFDDAAELVESEDDEVMLSEEKESGYEKLVTGLNSVSTSSLSSINVPDIQLVSNETVLVCEWDSEANSKLFGTVDSELESTSAGNTWSNPSIIPNPELEENRRVLAQKNASSVALSDCLDLFSKPEVLGDNDLWYCPTCEELRQATKTIELWQTGDILTIHLKRFESQRSFSDKINMVVDFPIEGLDLSEHLVGHSGADSSPAIYDLIGVDNHYGGIGGGHYTAYVKNNVDQNWYYYNDSRVSAADPKDSITGAAYLLFYRRRVGPQDCLGSEKLAEMIESGRRDWKAHEQELARRNQETNQQIYEYNKYFAEQQRIAEERAISEAEHAEVKSVEMVGIDESDIEEVNEVKYPKINKNISLDYVPDSEYPIRVSSGESIPGAAEGDDYNDNRRKQRLISRLSRSVFIDKDSESNSIISSPVSETSEFSETAGVPVANPNTSPSRD